MFESTDQPRVFGLPPGADFGNELVAGLHARFRNMSVVDIARTEIFVNTARMQRRIRSIFDDGLARLLPRVRLVTDLAFDAQASGIPLPVSSLRRRLELIGVISALLDKEPDLAPRAALYDLADSLATLMDEMQGEGVNPETLQNLDVSDQSGHWQRALKFLNILGPFFSAIAVAPDKEARQRLVIEQLVESWRISPPTHPIIVAGSTGSRGATGLLMQAVARLPQGALVLPGFDSIMPESAWDSLGKQGSGEDHPQYRFKTLLENLSLTPKDVVNWTEDPIYSNARNKLVSLSLRPAPVTNDWMREGPKLDDLAEATRDMVLVEAPSPRIEAETIALRLRQAAEDGVTAALITPDRMLTRQVAAALDRWDITPDDSAGVPLAQSAPGRLLRHVGDLIGTEQTAEKVLIVLKHPLCNTGGGDRNQHLLRTRELELRLRRYGPPILDKTALVDWAERTSENDPGRLAWANWLGDVINDLAAADEALLADLLAFHIHCTEWLARGPDGDDAGALWEQTAGREAQRVCTMLQTDSDAGGVLSTFDYVHLFNAVLAQGVVRDRDLGHPNILIWGTLEARVQGADLVILGGLNDGVWPESPAPDPWLNRQMRQAVGLLLPERRIGLSAHDYQQAVCAKEVWITRALRSADSETVPSRWLNRLTNLLSGLPEQGGPELLERMRDDGAMWIAKAAALQVPEQVTPKAKRPSPQPPVAARPKELSVTRIKTLIRDPFAIYAEKILRLKQLDPLKVTADPSLRGEVFHKILELFIASRPDATDPAALRAFLTITERVLQERCPWPTVRMQWLTRLTRIAPRFLSDEAARQSIGSLVLIEADGAVDILNPAFRLIAKADRMDRDQNGDIIIYDYKTGEMPSAPQQEKFDKQLLLEAAMVERGAFDDLGPAKVASAAFIEVNSSMRIKPAPLEKSPADQVWSEFLELLRNWQDPGTGYTARLAHFSNKQSSQYDHLSRFGEWSMADDIAPEVLK
ncbi:double-strand break repair protein AddB [Cognatiyoonia koreensis]|uniref:Double-strand break repair protein AddB n=1 Tax=Cognatiyoonia koreensis TaxID=364200 RepID=A0A1I0RPX3_9RHOB|nr:double-strand break repair protein AddB [Cognatiyoonia koreensis]SEW43324.1 double-strand break repair protein AddB [Cognatiyoonia koreensis]